MALVQFNPSTLLASYDTTNAVVQMVGGFPESACEKCITTPTILEVTLSSIQTGDESCYNSSGDGVKYTNESVSGTYRLFLTNINEESCLWQRNVSGTFGHYTKWQGYDCTGDTIFDYDLNELKITVSMGPDEPEGYARILVWAQHRYSEEEGGGEEGGIPVAGQYEIESGCLEVTNKVITIQYPYDYYLFNGYTATVEEIAWQD